MEQPSSVIVKHTADKMKAFITLSQGPVRATAGMVLTELLHKGIVHGINNDVINKFVASPQYGKYVEVAQGTCPAPGTDGRVFVLTSAEGPVTRPLCDFTIVEAGAQLARRVPPKPGTDGMDIFGNVIVAPPVKDVELLAGDGVISFSNDANLLLAKNRGVFKRGSCGTISVQPYMEIGGDVAVGDVSFAGYVKIMGAVKPGAMVDVTGSLAVMGAAEGVVIKCGGNLALRSAAKYGQLTIECAKNMEAASIENSTLTIEGNVTVSGAIYHSRVVAKGIVNADSIIGGSVSAAGGIQANNVGEESAKGPTVLDVTQAHEYAKELQALKNSLEMQEVLIDGHVSNLYRYVRDNMDSMGSIAETEMPALEAYAEELAGSVDACREIEEDAEKLKTLLKDTEDCCVNAKTVYPNVVIKLGNTEQNVTSVLNNVHLKPTRVVT